MRLIKESHVLVWYFNLHASFQIFFTFKVRFFYALETMTSPWYYDVTYLFTYPDEICTAYVKLNYNLRHIPQIHEDTFSPKKKRQLWPKLVKKSISTKISKKEPSIHIINLVSEQLWCKCLYFCSTSELFSIKLNVLFPNLYQSCPNALITYAILRIRIMCKAIFFLVYPHIFCHCMNLLYKALFIAIIVLISYLLFTSACIFFCASFFTYNY